MRRSQPRKKPEEEYFILGEKSGKAWQVGGNARRLCPWNTRGRERKGVLRCGGKTGGRLGQRGVAWGAVGISLGDSKYSGRTWKGVSRVPWSDAHVWRMDWKRVWVEVWKLVGSSGVCPGERYQWKWRQEK